MHHALDQLLADDEVLTFLIDNACEENSNIIEAHLPYWESWNTFFTRQFKDRKASRPIAQRHNNQIVVSANDGSLFRWDENIAAKDVFWFKDMPYSLADILSSDNPEQQQVIDDHNLVDLFTDGSIFQTYLTPYNYHRWWCPVNGHVLFDPICVPGCYFNKLVIPDFGGATTSSLPYLAQVNARGLIEQFLNCKNCDLMARIPHPDLIGQRTFEVYP